jgi:hypothetical protein
MVPPQCSQLASSSDRETIDQILKLTCNLVVRYVLPVSVGHYFKTGRWFYRTTQNDETLCLHPVDAVKLSFTGPKPPCSDLVSVATSASVLLPF